MCPRRILRQNKQEKEENGFSETFLSFAFSLFSNPNGKKSLINKLFIFFLSTFLRLDLDAGEPFFIKYIQHSLHLFPQFFPSFLQIPPTLSLFLYWALKHRKKI